MTNIKFLKSREREFAKTLRERVDDYFRSNDLSKFGNGRMVIKTVIMLSIFLIPIIIINTGIISGPILLFTLYGISGLGMAGVGMGVMHDAIHGSYSKKTKVNKYLGYSMNLLGANANVWRIQHNVLHHTYTNIDNEDDDINAPFFLRFSPNAKRYWIHRYQHLYVWVFYGLSTIAWITTKDFVRLTRYRNKGFFKGQFTKELVRISGWKVFYYSYALILPLIIVPQPIWIILLAFLSMHFVAGICTSIIFQPAHVVTDTVFPKPDKEGLVARNWAEHQLMATCNYAPENKVLSWLIGGLNFQIEHHLMPNICHVHYQNISPIVSETAKEFNVPYMVKKSFKDALWDHVRMLRQLGRT